MSQTRLLPAAEFTKIARPELSKVLWQLSPNTRMK